MHCRKVHIHVIVIPCMIKKGGRVRKKYCKPSVGGFSVKEFFLVCQGQYTFTLDFRQCPNPDMSGCIIQVQDGQSTGCLESEPQPGQEWNFQCSETGSQVYLSTLISVTPGGTPACGNCPEGDTYTLIEDTSPAPPSNCTVTSFVTPSEADPDVCQAP